MRKIIIAFFLIACKQLVAQEPKWVNYLSRNSFFPSSEFLVGYTSEINTDNQNQNELLAKLEGVSKDQLVANIMIDIRSITTLNIQNINAETQETFKHNSTSFSRAKISGLKIETYYDNKKKIAYAIAYAKKSDVLKLYQNEIEQQISTIQTTISQAEGSDKQEVLKKYFETQPAFRKIEEAQTLLITLTGNFNFPSTQRELINELKAKVDAKINGLKNSTSLSVEDAAYFISFGLHAQTDETKMPVKIINFNYQDTPMASPFSRKFKAVLEQSLIQEGHYNVVDPAAPNIVGFVLTGNYWEEKDKLKITVLLRDEVTGNAVASASCYVPLNTLQQNNVDYKPENYKDAIVNMKLFAKDELKGGELQVDVFTNKGKEGQLFTGGESMKIFVRANRECYLRFVYHLADGSKALLLDNYYINRDKVNQAYELPYEFECAEPFGVETLQLNAQASSFEPLTIRHASGYDFIQETTEQIISKTRGFKKKDDALLKAEQILVITTMKK